MLVLPFCNQPFLCTTSGCRDEAEESDRLIKTLSYLLFSEKHCRNTDTLCRLFMWVKVAGNFVSSPNKKINFSQNIYFSKILMAEKSKVSELAFKWFSTAGKCLYSASKSMPKWYSTKLQGGIQLCSFKASFNTWIKIASWSAWMLYLDDGTLLLNSANWKTAMWI